MVTTTVVEPISKILPIGLCRNYATGKDYVDGKRVSICLVNPLREANLRWCSSENCPDYDPEWYGFEGQYRNGK